MGTTSEDLINRIRQRADNPRTQTQSYEPGYLPRYPPATAATLAEAESRLGFRLEPFLAEVYLKVGNGGFGPGYGVIGLPSGHVGDEEASIVEMYESRRVVDPSDPSWAWPEAVIPFCEWGCLIFTCVDCGTGSILTFDPNVGGGEPMSQKFGQTHDSMASWFEDWVNGVSIWAKMFEVNPESARTVMNPATREPMVIYANRLRQKS